MFFSFFKWFQDEISYLSPMQFDWFFIFSDPKIPKIPGKKKPGVMPATHWTKVSSRKLQKSISRLAARHFNNSCLDQWIFCGFFSGKKNTDFFLKNSSFFLRFFLLKIELQQVCPTKKCQENTVHVYIHLTIPILSILGNMGYTPRDQKKVQTLHLMAPAFSHGQLDGVFEHAWGQVCNPQ